MITQHHALLEDKRTSSCPQSAQGCITKPAAKLTLPTIQNILFFNVLLTVHLDDN
jgi:hypothetical protein